jgi:hypothetical protein
MRAYIKKLQSKPEDIRKQILIGLLVVCMSFVGLIWVSSLGYKFNKESKIKVEEDIKPFALFSQTISDTYNNISASVGSIPLGKKQSEVKVEEKEENQKVINLIPVEYQ